MYVCVSYIYIICYDEKLQICMSLRWKFSELKYLKMMLKKSKKKTFLLVNSVELPNYYD